MGQLILGATRGACDDIARLLAQRDGGLWGARRTTLRGLARELAVEPASRRGLAFSGQLALEALAARCVARCRAEGPPLDYFGPVADMPGFPRALAATLLELRLQAVDPEPLAATGAPGRDLASLLIHYQRQLADRSLADYATVLRLAAESASGASHRFAGLPLLLLDCPPVSARERELLAALAARSPHVAATCLAADQDGISTLEKILGVKAELVESHSSAATLNRLRQSLFAPQPPPPSDLDASMEVFSAPGEGLECVEIARRLRLLAAQGIGFDRMAVLLRRPESYQPLLEDALRRADIPGYFSRGVARPDPAGRAFLALLACAAEGLSASRFAEYLSLGQVPAADDALEDDQSPVVGGTLRAPFKWEELLVEAAVIGGRDRWSRRLRGLERELQLRIRELDDPADPHRRHLEQQIERLGHLQQLALPLIAVLDSLPRRANWGEWLERLKELAARSLGRPDSVLAVLAELEPMDEVGPVELLEVRGVLHERLSFLRAERPHHRYGQVFVTSIGEARGRSFDVIFLPGLGEGIFPRKAMEDPLLLDRYRQPLAAGLLLQDDRVARERLLLHAAAAAARIRLVVSYPRIDALQGRPRVPSFYALEVFRAAAGRLPELRQFTRTAAQASPAQLGWPAPRDPAEAIDDAEYDLAFLGRYLGPRREPGKARGRYLLQVNSHLDRSLRARWERWHKPWSRYDGLVKPDAATLVALGPQRLRARSYSPTTLERFAACPYRFFLHGIHRLRTREEKVPLQQLDPLTRGGIFHRVQFELLGELRAAGLLPVAGGNLPQVFDLADRVLNRVAAQEQEELAPAIPRVWSGEIEDLRTDLHGWLVELAHHDLDWQPVHFEFAFGLPAGPERDPLSRPAEAVIFDGFRLRGSMDLVERHITNGALRVTDHKTGKAPRDTPPLVGGGEVLQPVLYGLAAEHLLEQRVDFSRLFYCTQRGRYKRLDVPLHDDARAGARRVLETIDQAIEQGFLPAAPRAGACQYCDYTLVCGPYEELRVRRKQRDPLAALDQVRKLP